MHNESGAWDSFVIFFSNNWHNWEITGATFCWFHGIMESVESNNFYNLGTTLTTGHLAKLHLAVSQSLLAQELFWLSVESNNFYNLETTGTTIYWSLAHANIAKGAN